MRNKIKVQRVMHNMTQAEFAVHAKTSKWTISQLELNHYVPSAALAVRISKLFNLTVEELFDFTDENGVIEALKNDSGWV